MRWLWFPLGLALLAWDPAALASAPKLALLSVFALLSAGYVAYRRTPLQLSAPLGFALALIVFSSLSLLWGSAAGLRQQCVLIACGCIALAARSALSRAELRRQLVNLARFLGVGGASWAALQFVQGARGSFIHGGAGNPNWLGLLLALCLVLSLPSARELESRWRWPLLLVLGLEATGLWLAQSRVAGVALGGGLIYFGLRRLFPRGTRWVVLGALLLPLAVPLLGGWIGSADQLLSDAAPGWLNALNGRRWIWHATLDAWRAAPLGVGSGGFGSAYLEAQGRLLAQLELGPAARAFQSPGSAHSDWLQCLLEQGPVGFGLMLAWFGSALRSSAAAPERPRAEPPRAEPPRGLVGARRGAPAWLQGEVALVVVLICALADTPLGQPGVVALTLLTTAALGPSFRRRILARTVGARAWWGVLLLLGLTTREACAAWFAQRCASQAREAPGQRLELLRQAVALYPRDPDLQLEYGVALIDAGDAQHALDAAQHSLALSRSVSAELLRAKALSQVGESSSALQRLTDARQLSPGSFRMNFALAALNLSAGRLDPASKHLRDAELVLPADPSIALLRKRIELARQAQELR